MNELYTEKVLYIPIYNFYVKLNKKKRITYNKHTYISI